MSFHSTVESGGLVAPSIGGLFLLACRARVAAPFFRKLPAESIHEFKRAGLEIAELRLDLAGAESPDAAADLAQAYNGLLPTIVTARASFEGGKWRGDEASRLSAIRAALPFADAVDIELAADEILPQVAESARSRGKTVIVSRHNFTATDSRDEMERALDRARLLGADIFKLACAVGDEADASRLLDFVRARGAEFPLAATAMGVGEVARRTRMALARKGSVLAFASADGESAPGQWTLAETVAALRD